VNLEPHRIPPPISLEAAWQSHRDRVLGPRGDEHRLHMSDLHACDYATWQRIAGIPPLPFDDGAFAMFERGLAIESRLLDALTQKFSPEYEVRFGLECEINGVIGHIDFALYKNGEPFAVIDATTTAAKTPEIKYGHALKSAAYALAIGAPFFAEWVFCYGFGGTIVAQEEYWFVTEPFTKPVMDRIHFLNSLSVFSDEPKQKPPIDPATGEPEYWRCGKNGKSYCNAICPRNAKVPKLITIS